MTWNLWLDDVRDPSFYLKADKYGDLFAAKFRFYTSRGLTCPDFVWCLDHKAAIEEVQKRGAPRFMALDHDLGWQSDAMQFLKWLAAEYPEHPPDWFAHSDNPEGVKNMNSFMDSWHRSLT